MSEEQVDAIAAQISTCTLCPLHEGRKNTVPGSGNPDADIMFIGEAPGQYEDEQGVPFVGRSGQYLNYLLDKIGLVRGDVFITNMVKCRPPGNRDPQKGELAACKPYLDEQVQSIDPKVIILVGRISMAKYFPKGKISDIHGQPLYQDGRAYYPIYHPAAALRNPRLKRDMEDDFTRLVEVIEEVKKRRTGEDSGNTVQDNTSQDPPEQLTLL
ncbi:MAG: uracil-DNA glycosylase [Chloroflexota bacterium]